MMHEELWSKLQKTYQVFRRRDFWMSKQIDIPKVRLGSKYGGWWFSPKNLGKHSTILSFGLGEDISFDLEMIKNFSCHVDGFDPTPKSISMIKALNPPKGFTIHEFGLGVNDGDLILYVPLDSNHISCSCVDNFGTKPIIAKVKSIESIIKENNLKQIDILKMDIEGAEYEVINSIQSVSIPIHQILIEFHHFYPQVDFSLTKEAIQKLNNFGYKIFSIEGYNYSFIKDNSGVSI